MLIHQFVSLGLFPSLLEFFINLELSIFSILLHLLLVYFHLLQNDFTRGDIAISTEELLDSSSLLDYVIVRHVWEPFMDKKIIVLDGGLVGTLNLRSL